MKKNSFKRGTSFFLALLMCFSTIFGLGTTAFAAGEQAEVYMIGFPRDGDANYGGEWGHPELHYMNGWTSGKSNYTNIRAMNSYEGNICYCIEPGVPQDTGDTFTSWDENFWDNYPSELNNTISPDEIKTFIGRILQYGYTGPISLNWRSQNEGGDKLAYAVATQLLIWETVIGERNSDFSKVDTGSYDAVLDSISVDHPLYSQIMSYYNSIASSVKTHATLPSFLAKSTGKAQEIEMEWNGSEYIATLTDSKTFKFTDINYLVASREDKESMFLTYSELLNSLDSGASTKLTIYNHRMNQSSFEQSILMPMRGDGLDEYREEYNRMLLDKATGGNGITQEKFITISVQKKDIREARAYFARIGADLSAHFAALGSKCVEMTAEERLHVLHDFFRPGDENAFTFSFQDKMRKGHGVSSASVTHIPQPSRRMWNTFWTPCRPALCCPTLSLSSCSIRRLPTVRSLPSC